MKKYFDLGNLVVIAVTVVLFVVALFLKGVSKDLLLEAGVLLVSIKLIMNGYRTSVFYQNIQKDLDELKALLKEKKDS